MRREGLREGIPEGAREFWFAPGELRRVQMAVLRMEADEQDRRLRLIRGAKQGDLAAAAELWTRYHCRVTVPAGDVHADV